MNEKQDLIIQGSDEAMKAFYRKILSAVDAVIKNGLDKAYVGSVTAYMVGDRMIRIDAKIESNIVRSLVNEGRSDPDQY